MAVQGVKGSGIGQVTIPSAEEYLKRREGYVSGIGQAAAPYMQGLIEGEGPMAERYMPSLGPAEEFRKKVGLPPATTRSEQLGDFVANIPLYGLEGIRRATGVIGDAPAIIGDFLASPTDAAMADIISKEAAGIESELSPFREQARRMGQTVPEMAAEQDETQKQIDDLTSSISATKAEQAVEETQTPAGASTTTQGNTVGMPSAAEQQTGDQQTDDIENPFEKTLKQAMDNAAAIRGEKPKMKLEDYKQEFADATGVDISGKVDKSHALMALGLALMQNKAGRDFNVSSALSALGEAGEKAMPAFVKAKSEAKAAKLAAGKYALGQLSQDEQAKATRLAAAEATVSDLLGKQQDFFSKLQLQRDQQVADTLLKDLEHKNAMREAAAEGEDLYTDKLTETPLFQDAPDIFKMKTYIVKGNKDAPVKFEPNYLNSLGSALPAMEADLNRKADELKFIKSAIESGSDVFTQSGAFIQSVARGFGINVNSELPPIKQAQILLDKIATQSTAEILGEAGKTISDGDRDRVEKIVGKISALDPSSGADRAVLLQKLNSVFELVVGKGRRNLDTAYGTLLAAGGKAATFVPEGYRRAVEAANRAVSDDLSDEEFDEVNAGRKRLGLPPRTR